MKKIKQKKRTAKSGGEKFIIKSVLTGSLSGVAVFFASLALFALIAYKQDLSEEIYWIFAVIASVLSAFISGYVAVRPIKKNGLILGMASVIPLFSVILLTASIVNRTGISIYSWISLGVMLLTSGISGIFAANKKKKMKLK